jgi:hypothetical protein
MDISTRNPKDHVVIRCHHLPRKPFPTFGQRRWIHPTAARNAKHIHA